MNMEHDTDLAKIAKELLIPSQRQQQNQQNNNQYVSYSYCQH